MIKSSNKVIVIMPAYNAAKTLLKTYNDIPKDIVKKIILVDDGSSDKTVKIANKLKLDVYRHPANLGYGGNQKTCYWEALKYKPDIVVMIHPDYQYDATLTKELIYPILKGRADIMLGSRIQSRRGALKGGMPWWKYYGNRFLTILENIILGLNLSEYHTGFRAYSIKALKKIPFMRFSNDFVFDQQIIFSAAANKLRIGEIFVPVRYFPEASSTDFFTSVRYGLGILWLCFLYLLNKKSRIFIK